jgi:hypothetical protein
VRAHAVLADTLVAVLARAVVNLLIAQLAIKVNGAAVARVRIPVSGLTANSIDAAKVLAEVNVGLAGRALPARVRATARRPGARDGLGAYTVVLAR